MAYITFSSPEVLWFLACIPLLFATHIITLQIKRRMSIKFSHFDLLSRTAKSSFVSSSNQKNMTRKDWLLLTTRACALMCVILAAAGATIWYVGEASDADYILLMDTSSSMTATDFYPDRLEASKAAAKSFIEIVKKPVRIGVITFSGVSFVATEPVEDMALVRRKIDEIAISDIGGTDIGGAIITGTNMLRSSERSKTLVLMTDGRSNQGITIDDAIEYALRQNVNVHTIGMGTTTGGLLAEFPLVPFTIDEESLSLIANKTGGKYFRTASNQDLLASYEQIASSSTRLISRSLVPGLMILILLLLFFEWGFLGMTYRVIP